MIKVIAPAQRHPRNRSLADFHRYWGDGHGPLFANTRNLRGYVQHLTLPEAYGGPPAPTYDGVSMFWFDDLESQDVPTNSPELLALLEPLYHEQLLVDGYRNGTWSGGWPHLDPIERGMLAKRIGLVRWVDVADHWPELRALPELTDL
jgi:uncharacterized protein (TIGR02118 family)